MQIPTAPVDTDLAFLVAGAVGLLGVRSADVRATGDDYELKVHYGRITRPGLATPWSVEVRRLDGDPIDEELVVATTASYFDMFDENGLDPDPDASTADGDRTIWRFDAPDPPTDLLEITYDARIEPGVQRGMLARTALLDDEGNEVVAVTYRTTVLP